jgi:hypothetical protein
MVIVSNIHISSLAGHRTHPTTVILYIGTVADNWIGELGGSPLNSEIFEISPRAL